MQVCVSTIRFFSRFHVLQSSNKLKTNFCLEFGSTFFFLGEQVFFLFLISEINEPKLQGFDARQSVWRPSRLSSMFLWPQEVAIRAHVYDYLSLIC